ncbi:unnamed protein product [Didymodactylos carnosus]|uniref:XLF-like N-terminal domain-containing protein n=1 Tax=Didymodactylos carnosus TaxID=1234261 RepID=A0A814YDQ2_9BILA|nr:unnamed protein product [Didymodactylos carnosus]CAF1227964.1 unnamed protein product [Didymodactylos carnosus]CAF3854251.1 unnamed protein product [Didymodactylos carnosus]CAF3990780.1 unnamed protein product [Didymodactylos carnosus]
MMVDFVEFSSTYPFEFEQSPIVVIELSSLTFHESPENQILCQPYFSSNSYKIAFYANSTAYYEELTEDKIRQRIAILNPQLEITDIKTVLEQIREMLDNRKSEINFKLLSPNLVAIEIKEGPFKYKFRCEQKTELYEEQYVKHLLIQIRELQLREKKLQQLLTSRPENEFNGAPVDEDGDDDDYDLLNDNLFEYAFNQHGRQLVSMAFLKRDYFKYRKAIDPSATAPPSLATKIAMIIDGLPLAARKLNLIVKRKENELAEIEEKIKRKRFELEVLGPDRLMVPHHSHTDEQAKLSKVQQNGEITRTKQNLSAFSNDELSYKNGVENMIIDDIVKLIVANEEIQGKNG